MRALTGAIITAAALIGLGLFSQGLGRRYENFIAKKPAAQQTGDTMTWREEPDLDNSRIKISQLDNPMKLCLTVLVLSVIVGLGITFVGLMYHHHKRFHEHIRLHGQPAPPGGGHPLAS